MVRLKKIKIHKFPNIRPGKYFIIYDIDMTKLKIIFNPIIVLRNLFLFQLLPLFAIDLNKFIVCLFLICLKL